jgi:hypothetical protein
VDLSKAFHQFTYDRAGRTATRERRLPGGTIETHEFRWDGQDKLRQVLGAGGFAAGYDGDGLRVNRSDLSATRVFHRSGSTVVQETGGAGGALTHTPGLAQRSAAGDPCSTRTGWAARGT